MLFDPRPKQDRKDLFGRDDELDTLLRIFRSKCPLILVTGIRRIGKTSLIKVALKEADQPYIYLDMRILEEEGFSKIVLYRLISGELSRIASRWIRIKDFLKTIKGVKFVGIKVELDWSEYKLTLFSLLNALNNWVERDDKISYLILAFDEAQLLRYMMGGKGRIDFRSLIAYSYDNLPNIKFLLTGSEVGLLMNFIGVEEPNSSLYGRYKEELRLERFNREISISFLEAGFKGYDIKFDTIILEKVVDKIDGVVGWLTYFGYMAVRKGSINDELINETLNIAIKMVKEKLSKITQRSRYYKLILKAIGEEGVRWIDIKRRVEAWCGKPITSIQLTRNLKTLTELNYIQKENNIYKIPDPIIRKATKQL